MVDIGEAKIGDAGELDTIASSYDGGSCGVSARLLVLLVPDFSDFCKEPGC